MATVFRVEIVKDLRWVVVDEVGECDPVEIPGGEDKEDQEQRCDPVEFPSREEEGVQEQLASSTDRETRKVRFMEPGSTSSESELSSGPDDSWLKERRRQRFMGFELDTRNSDADVDREEILPSKRARGEAQVIPTLVAPAEERARKVRKHECPFCQRMVGTMKSHLEQEHFPWYFNPETACWQCEVAEGSAAYLRCKHLKARCPLGRFNNQYMYQWLLVMKGVLDWLMEELGETSHEGLRIRCIKDEMVPTIKNYMIPLARKALYRRLEAAMGETVSVDYGMSPPNRPVCLLQWEVVMRILRTLPVQAVEEFRLLCRKPTGLHTPKTFYVDSHAHVSRLLTSHSVSSLSQCLQTCVVHNKPELEGIINNCVFPSCRRRWRELLPDTRVFFTFGCHPSTGEFPVGLEKEVAHARCVGIGETGLDYRYSVPIEKQVAVLQAHAHLAKDTGKPLVLHIRGSSRVPTEQAYQKVKEVLEQILPTKFQIYLHCYCGGQGLSQNWFRTFPNTLLGISSTWYRSEELAQEMARLPLQRISLESDAPYLYLKNVPQAPWNLCSLADEIGKCRNLPADVILEICRSNAKKFFRI